MKEEAHRYVKYSGKTRPDKDGHAVHEHRMLQRRRCVKASGPICAACGRRGGRPDGYGGDVPMSPIGTCGECGKHVRPVCADESECCSLEPVDCFGARP